MSSLAAPTAVSTTPTWRNRWIFILAASGSAVGLGNLWKFPYILGENGGGAFLLVYLLCIFLIGIPIMLAETVIGYRGRQSPVNAIAGLARESGRSKAWSLLGILGGLTGLLILSFYSVVAGWSIHYFLASASGELQSLSSVGSSEFFGELLADKQTMILWHSVFMLVSVAVIALGVQKGIGRAVKVLMPLLFLLLIGLLVYSIFQSNMSASVAFLFDFKPEKLSLDGVQAALGHAFFTLSIGMGAIMVYGAYLPEGAPLGRTVVTVAMIDTLVALVAGLIIFSIVFAHEGLSPSSGPGLLFQTLPIAFGQMMGGLVVGSVFFLLVSLAALSSSISMIEPAVAWLIEVTRFSRLAVASAFGVFAWFLGLGTVLSFNDWAEFTFLGNTVFDNFDKLSNRIMLPLGGLGIAIFAGWCVKKSYVDSLFGNKTLSSGLYLVLKYVSPILLILVMMLRAINPQ